MKEKIDMEVLWAKATENFMYHHCSEGSAEHCHLWGDNDISCPCITTWETIGKSFKDQKTFCQITRILNEYLAEIDTLHD